MRRHAAQVWPARTKKTAAALPGEAGEGGHDEKAIDENDLLDEVLFELQDGQRHHIVP